jgi:hypothetical protein
MFPVLLENVVPRSLKSFFQLDQHVNIMLYLKEATALRHSSKSTTQNMIFSVRYTKYECIH